MTLIEWRDDFNTGIGAVDHEHRLLIDLLNALYDRLGTDADAAEIEDFLGEVYAQIAAHFALEEKMMREADYDEYEDHKADHDRLLDDIREIMDRQAGGATDEFGSELSESLKSWFVEHFKTKDPRLHRLLPH